MRLLFSRADPSAAGDLDETRLVELYRHRVPQDHGIWLRSNFVTSLDGSIQGANGRSGGINAASDHFIFALHRAHADAIVVGAQTVRAEGYRAVDLAPWQRAIRDTEGLAPFPLLVIITRSLDVNPAIAAHGSKEVGPVLAITTSGKTAEQLAPFTDAGIEVVQLDGGDVDMVAAMDHLAAGGYRRVLCEGGSHLHRDLLAADLVDEMSLTLAPMVVGGAGRRTTAGAAIVNEPSFQLNLALLADDGTLFTNYLRARS